MTQFQPMEIIAPTAPPVPGGIPQVSTTSTIPSFGKTVNPSGAAEFYYTMMAETFANGAALQIKITDLVEQNAAKKKKEKESLIDAIMDLAVGSKITLEERDVLLEAVRGEATEYTDAYNIDVDNLGGTIVDLLRRLQKENK